MIYKESGILELKSSFREWKEIIITLSAFANKKGGTVIVGLDDGGQPLHLQLGKKTIEDFVNKIKNHTDPVLYPSINMITFGLGEIVEIIVPQSDYKPVFAFEKAWIRVGKSNVKLSTDKLRELILRYSYQEFDNQMVSFDNSDMEFDTEVLDKFYAKSYQLPKRLNVAEYLCFSKVNYNYPQAVVKAARFKGNTPVKFLDTRNYNDSLVLITDLLLEFIRKNIRFQYIITGKAERDERWEYPMVALREVILNAIVHRDYKDPGNIQIRIFDDFIEIWSPGLLPKELDINNLIKNNRSIPRNKQILKLIHLIGEIENWGTGFARIEEACNKNGNPLPLFKERAGAFVIRIDNAVTVENASGTKSGGVNTFNLSNLYDAVKGNQGISLSKLLEVSGLSKRSLERWLKKLKDQNRIEFKGAPKTGGCFLK